MVMNIVAAVGSVAITFAVATVLWALVGTGIERYRGRQKRRPPGLAATRLHHIRRGMELVQFNAAVHRSGNHLRRELHDELSALKHQRPHLR
jgi:hypothetical protein